MRTILFVISLACCVATTAQTPNRTPEQIRKDSIELEKYKKLYPEWYRFNRAPFLLSDSSDILQGYSHQLRMEYNVIVDSVHNNFHNNMPDTTTVTPYSSIPVGGPRVKISYLEGVGFMGEGTAYMIPYTREAYLQDSADFRNGKDTVRGMVFPTMRQTNDILYVRVTVNGKPVFDWKEIQELPSSFWKGSETYSLRGYNYPPFTMRSYGNEYLICDTTLKVNDQLLIEIKERNRNWMLERYNITRVAATPRATAIRITGEDAIAPTEKKTLASAPAPRTSR